MALIIVPPAPALPVSVLDDVGKWQRRPKIRETRNYARVGAEVAYSRRQVEQAADLFESLTLPYSPNELDGFGSAVPI
jgi:hypothetical protein